MATAADTSPSVHIVDSPRVDPAIPLMQHRIEGTAVGAEYTLPCSAFTEAHLDVIQKALTLYPTVRAGLPPGLPYALWRRHGSNLVVPRALGLSNFGAPAIDERVEGDRMSPDTFAWKGPPLYEWQERTVSAVVSHLRTPPYYGGCLNAGCGLGKTNMFLAIAARMGVRTAVLVNKDFLMRQWIQRIHTCLPNASVGRAQGSVCESDADVVVVMIQSANRHEGAFRGVGLLAVDECHHLPARTYAAVARQFPAKYVVGLSATLARGDNNQKAIWWLLGPTMVRVTRPTIGDACAATQVKMVDTRLRPVEVSRNGRLDWARTMTLLIRHPERNRVIADEIRAALAAGRRPLVISERVEHLRELMRLVDTGNDAAAGLLYVGESGKRKREDRDAKFEAGPTSVYTTKQMASEAFDWPECNCVMITTPMPATSGLAQSVGRCQRRNGGSDNNGGSVVVDFRDDSPALRSIAQQRVRYYTQSGYGWV